MSIKKRVFNVGLSTINAVTGLFGKRNKACILANAVDELVPSCTIDTNYGVISFYCFGNTPFWRAETLLTKEPETIEWIEGFGSQDTLWDIGANVGCYSLYAAKHGIRVMSFEPSAINYFLLQKNIQLNRLDETVSAFCMAFNDLSKIGFLNMSTMEMGGAMNSFGDSLDQIDYGEGKYPVQFKQGMIGWSVDEFISFFGIEPPTHIKIDVDGIEDKIILGARNTLKLNAVKSVLVELDFNQTEYNKTIFTIMEDADLHMISKKHSHMYDTGEFSSVYNCIFRRPG